LGIVIFTIGLIVYLFRVKTSTVSKACGGPVTINCYGWDPKHNVETYRTVTLNYDLKRTIDAATSIMWFSKCERKDQLIIDGKVYSIFGDCGSQKGCQLIRRDDKYYLIKEKLNIVKE